MPRQVALDLGEYGIILVEADEIKNVKDSGMIPAGRLDEMKRSAVVSARAVLQRPLKGLVDAMVEALPTTDVGDHYRLDEFTVEFNLGFGVELGTEGGTLAIAKLTPNGVLKCVYTWKRRDNSLEPSE